MRRVMEPIGRERTAAIEVVVDLIEENRCRI